MFSCNTCEGDTAIGVAAGAGSTKRAAGAGSTKRAAGAGSTKPSKRRGTHSTMPGGKASRGKRESRGVCVTCDVLSFIKGSC